jgi:hypothetical protein
MSQAANIVINDGAATPVATTFAPESVTPALSTFADRTSGTSIGFRRLTVSTQFASGKQVVNRGKFSIAYPIISTVNGVSTVAYTLRANVEVILPDASTVAERNNLYAFLKNGLANALVTGALRDLDPLY